MRSKKCDYFLNSNDCEAKNQCNQLFIIYTEKNIPCFETFYSHGHMIFMTLTLAFIIATAVQCEYQTKISNAIWNSCFRFVK